MLPDRPAISVVVPVFNAAETLQPCLEALAAAVGPDDEIVVADDGSTDGALEALPPGLAARVHWVRSTRNIGRGPIRNLGVRHTTGAVVLFVDADVVVRRDAVERVRDTFGQDTGIVALIGSYDAAPPAAGVVSQYRNLLHHHTHQTGGPRATHFWTGLGAVRRHVFDSLGGLDEVLWARNMEDVEFGHRLTDAGHAIVVDPSLQGTHLKHYTVSSMVRSDLIDRAIPWSRLLLQSNRHTDGFVTSWLQRLSALCAIGIVATGPATLVNRRFVAPLVVALGGFTAVNLPLWRFLARSRSVPFAAASWPLHLLHSVTSAIGFACAVATPRRGG
jgi:glycosyltransferase involved in cell wall biosynthesis